MTGQRIYLAFVVTSWVRCHFLTCFRYRWLKRKIVVVFWLFFWVNFGFVQLKPSKPELIVLLLNVNVILKLTRIFWLYLLKRCYFQDERHNNDEMIDVLAHYKLLPQLLYQINPLNLRIWLVVASDHLHLFETFQKFDVLYLVLQQFGFVFNFCDLKQIFRDLWNEFVVNVFVRLFVYLHLLFLVRTQRYCRFFAPWSLTLRKQIFISLIIFV